MSTDTNSELFERAGEVKSYFESTVLELAIDKAAEDNDLVRLEYLVNQGEQEMERQEQHGFNLLGESDEY